jgi:hypothetical protein
MLVPWRGILRYKQQREAEHACP